MVTYLKKAKGPNANKVTDLFFFLFFPSFFSFFFSFSRPFSMGRKGDVCSEYHTDTSCTITSSKSSLVFAWCPDTAVADDV